MFYLVLYAESAQLEQSFSWIYWFQTVSLIFVGGFPSNVIPVWGKFLWKLSKIIKSPHFKAEMALIQQMLQDTKETIVKGWMNIWRLSQLKLVIHFGYCNISSWARKVQQFWKDGRAQNLSWCQTVTKLNGIVIITCIHLISSSSLGWFIYWFIHLCQGKLPF